MKPYEQLLFMGVILCTVVMAYSFAEHRVQKEKDESFVNEDSIPDPPPSIEKRTAAVLMVMYDISMDPLVNTSDINVIYSIWSSTMAKRGLTGVYDTPELFEKLRDIVISMKLSPLEVMSVVRPYYELEKKEWQDLVKKVQGYKLQGVCSN